MSLDRQAQMELENGIRVIEEALGPVTVGTTVSYRDQDRIDRINAETPRGGEYMPFDFSRYQRQDSDFEDRPLIKGAEKVALIEAGTTITIQKIRTDVPTVYGTRAFLDVLVSGKPMTVAFGYGAQGFSRRDVLLDDLKTHIEETGEEVPVKIVKWGDQAQGIEAAEA